MTTLYFDTSDNRRTIVRLDNFQSVMRRAKWVTAEQLLGLIAATLESHHRQPADITAINYHAGPGSYTGLKVGAAVGNTLGLILGIPVNGRNIRRHQLPELNFTEIKKTGGFAHPD
jgi:tRNA A37 threonylcarbamoyladenosine modification protein TsaB